MKLNKIKILPLLNHFVLSGFLFCCFIISGFYIYHLYKYPKPLNRDYLFHYYSKDLILKTGGYLYVPGNPKQRTQHFLNFSPVKHPHTIRIGTFGDSHTFGDEVDKTETYPYQLQELLSKKFPDKSIEILNFGISGVGFQEQFLLWEKYAKKYKLDYILIGPRGFYPDRDTSFAKSWSRDTLRFPKMRFILSGNNKLKQIHIKGNTLEERYKNYYRLIPSWIALRYDRRPFQIWEKLFPILKNHIVNPFYYIKISMYKESSKINKLLLKKMSNLHNKKILFFTDHHKMFDMYQQEGDLYNFNFISFIDNKFYKVFFHHSSLGNEVIANTYFHSLIGEKKVFPFNFISCNFKDSNAINQELNRELYAVQSIQIIGGKTPVFTLKLNQKFQWHNEKSYYFDHKNKETKSFIAFSDKINFPDFLYVPVSIQLKEGMMIYIQPANGHKIPLRPIKALSAYGKFFNFYANYIINELDTSNFETNFELNKIFQLLDTRTQQTTQPIELFVENHKLGVLVRSAFSYQKKSRLVFIPVNGYEKSFLFMGPSSGQIREKDFPTEIPLYIQYNMKNGESFKSLIPDWRCKKEKKQIHLKLPNFKPIKWK